MSEVRPESANRPSAASPMVRLGEQLFVQRIQNRAGVNFVTAVHGNVLTQLDSQFLDGSPDLSCSALSQICLGLSSESHDQ